MTIVQRLLVSSSLPLLFLLGSSDAFAPRSVGLMSRCVVGRSLSSSLPESSSSSLLDATREAVQTKTLGLLTFDLDDTLYPIQPVIKEANAAFARAMGQYGFPDIQPDEIDELGRRIRDETAKELGPAAAASLTHTELRTKAIRKAMEKIILERKLQAAADDWATPVSDLTNIVVSSAKRWARTAVSESIVQAVLNAWEMERHHAAERHLYIDVIDALKQIKKDHPNVVVGAVTDGRANPLLMTFTLAPFFDFCMSWEDHQGGRSQFFKELSSVEGNAELRWIYQATLDKYRELAVSPSEVALGKDKPEEDAVWIHVGDDLAYDVGGAAQCGAKTVLLELAEKYGQTARHRFDDNTKQPSWSTTSRAELEKRRLLNEAAEEKVDKRIAFISRLPEAVNDILNGE